MIYLVHHDPSFQSEARTARDGDPEQAQQLGLGNIFGQQKGVEASVARREFAGVSTVALYRMHQRENE